MSRLPSSSTALCMASRTASGRASVTSPMPHFMSDAALSGLACVNAPTRLPISGKRYPAFSFKKLSLILAMVDGYLTNLADMQAEIEISEIKY